MVMNWETDDGVCFGVYYDDFVIDHVKLEKGDDDFGIGDAGLDKNDSDDDDFAIDDVGFVLHGIMVMN